MNKTFKKVTVGAAVAAALAMTAGAAQAITLSRPSAAVLIPYVLYDSANQVDTAVGLTTMGLNHSPEAGATMDLHWYFYNVNSCHEADDHIPMTHNDFYGFNWSYMSTTNPHAPVIGGCTNKPLDGMKGYMVVVNEAAGSVDTTSSFFGDAAMIINNWTAAAYVPVVPLTPGVDVNVMTSGYYDVCGLSTTGCGVSPNMQNIVFGDNMNDDLDMRYYVAGLGQRTDLVVWLDQNYTWSPGFVNAYTFDEAENGNSTGVNLPNELNVISLTNTPASPIGGVYTKKSGFITMSFPVGKGGSGYPANTSGTVNAVAFSLIFTNANGAAQTALAHERQ